MRARSLAIVIAAPFFTLPASAMNAAEVQGIFSKQKRRLAPPPRSLRSDRPGDRDYRYSITDERARELSQKSTYPELEVSTEAPDDQEFQGARSLASDEAPVAAPLSRESMPAPAKSYFNSPKRHKTVSKFSGERVFGLGFIGGGAYGVFGVEADFTVMPQWSAGIGVGTGMSYTTWSAYGRYYFKEAKWSPFFQAGYANWFLQRVSKTGEGLSPGFIADRFFQDKNGNFQDGQRLHLVYPAIGVLYQSSSGFAVSTMLQYFISLNGFNGGMYGDLGFHYYF